MGLHKVILKTFAGHWRNGIRHCILHEKSPFNTREYYAISWGIRK